MSFTSRRRFIEFAGSTLATLGLNSFNLLPKFDRYGKVLAQNTPRKLALLVGINQYQKDPLNGCVNDVIMQEMLLIHRFGFNPKDILILTDKQATRQGILEAFEEHLIKQAKPGDVAVFHYSGHGSRVLDPNPIIGKSPIVDSTGLNGTFVPVDSVLPAGYPNVGGAVDDIMGHTLFLLMSAIQTENFTAVLDSCFSGMKTRDFKVRSRDGGEKIEISSQEKAYQEQWLSRLDMSPEEFVQGYKTGVAKGVVLASAQPSQTAKDVKILDFHVGIFSYLLTQYLWQNTGTPENAIAYTNTQIPRNLSQNPLYEVKIESGYENKPLYFVNNKTPVANAVITEITGNQAQIWLGGLTVKQKAELKSRTIFNIVNSQSNSSRKVILQSRKGLVGIATIEGNIEVGTLLSLSGVR
ncbi:caspase family protein [Lyngbya sp. PCC 8106]|uniref:caspase family protein n=1 Tax=Lyngbya sp. (strain PCC 8106) TaxID=313612 RepID=UPI0000EAC7B3|nr:caspase family protein [Lyngbya sp. PCC 8106]EAW38601.1 Peptidase C14, caspase catalytic subunit p20 [Lyngbya sp. PCC 8106]